MTKDSTCRLHPTLEEAQQLISEALTKRKLLTMFVECKVQYQGRSYSTLNWGDRLVIVKTDGAFLVHQPTGYEAVNWQPSGSTISRLRDNDELVLKAARRSPREVLIVTLREIYLIAFMDMVDLARIEMLLTEKDLYDIISDHPQLIEQGFRTMTLQREFKKGVADFTGIDRQGNYAVLEIKKDFADTNAVKQLHKYVSEIRENEPSIRGILVAPGMNPQARRLAKSLKLEFATINLGQCIDLLAEKRRIMMGSLEEHIN